MIPDKVTIKPRTIDILFIALGIGVISCLRHGDLTVYLYSSIMLLIISLLSYGGKLTIKKTLFSFWVFSFWSFVVLVHLFNMEYYMGWRSIVVYLLPGLVLCIYSSKIKDLRYLWSIVEKGVLVADTLVIIYVLVHDFRSFFSGSILRLGNNASGNVNTVAMFLCYFASVMFFMIVYEGKKRVLPLFLATLIMILLTGSKKGLVGIAIFLLIISFFKFGFRIWKYASIIILVSIGLYLIYNNEWVYQALGRRLDAFWVSLGTSQENGSTGERLGMYRVGLNFFLKSPIWGNGYGYFINNTVYGTYSHSSFIEILVSFGIIGFVLYYYLHVRLLITAIKNRKKDSICILFIAILVMQLFFDSSAVGFYNNALMYYFLYLGSRMLLNNEEWILENRVMVNKAKGEIQQ